MINDDAFLNLPGNPNEGTLRVSIDRGPVKVPYSRSVKVARTTGPIPRDKFTMFWMSFVISFPLTVFGLIFFSLGIRIALSLIQPQTCVLAFALSIMLFYMAYRESKAEYKVQKLMWFVESVPRHRVIPGTIKTDLSDLEIKEIPRPSGEIIFSKPCFDKDE